MILMNTDRGVKTPALWERQPSVRGSLRHGSTAGVMFQPDQVKSRQKEDPHGKRNNQIGADSGALEPSDHRFGRSLDRIRARRPGVPGAGGRQAAGRSLQGGVGAVWCIGADAALDQEGQAHLSISMVGRADPQRPRLRRCDDTQADARAETWEWTSPWLFHGRLAVRALFARR